jgi:hypothetical protein
MSDDIGSLDGRDTPSSLSTMDAIDDRIGPDNHILDRVEATFAIRPPLRERRKIVDITDRMSHLTPDVILDGEEPWIRWYWTNVTLVVPGEKTLIDPRDTVKPNGLFDGETRKWSAANLNAAVFLDYFFNPREEMAPYDINDDTFQIWLFKWRQAAMRRTHAPDEVAYHSVPDRHETAAYRNWREHHNLNVEHRFFLETSLTYEILVMWDFNSTALEGDTTTPRISLHNIRFLLDIYDAFPRGMTHLLKVLFVYKDVRTGRYSHDSSTKRYFENDNRLGRVWHIIVKDALLELLAMKDAIEEAGLGKDSEGYLAGKAQLAEEIHSKISRTWEGDEKRVNRGHLKFFMFDAFKESRRVRRQDPDVRVWSRVC